MTLMSRLQISCLISVFLVCCAAGSANATKEIKLDSYRISTIDWQQSGNSWVYRIAGAGKPTYTMYELFAPHRVIVDIADGKFEEGGLMPLEMDKGPVSFIKADILTDQDPEVARVEFYLSVDAPYSVSSSGNDILVKFANEGEGQANAEETETIISDIKISGTEEETTISLEAGEPIHSFESTEVKKGDNQPARLVVDMAGVTTEERAVPAYDKSPVTVVRTEKYADGARVVIDSATAELFRYSIVAQDEGLVIMVKPAAIDPTPVIADITGLPADEIATPKPEPVVVPEKEVTVAEKESGERMPSASVVKSIAESGTDLTFAGYTQQKISVDFYKIDLHNVFRLIGDISGRNIVVDEGVGGSLTLALEDVPWDFVLDVILNLKDLAKEERYNTIVISQKSKSFTWPEKAEDNLEIKQEAISVTKRLDVPQVELETKKIIRQAKSMEDLKNYSGAIALYEKGFQRWPDNGELAKRIAGLALGKLGLNAKAAHYGQIASRLLPDDKVVALQTALSLANLERVQEAKAYFEKAVNAEKPPRHALASYAAFSEQNGSNQMALSLLAKFEGLYGTSLETMVSKARIYDKIGDRKKADEEYRQILLSGYEIPADLVRYIKGRLQ